ncbi:MAG: hypothetical protein WD063_01480 [Pirellulales bacterium]
MSAAVLIGAIALVAAFVDRGVADDTDAKSKSSARHTTEKLRGKVAWLEDALERRYGVATEPAAAETSVVLEIPDGTVLPIVPDTRGRAFAVDGRLRGVELELLVRRYEKAPMIQVIRVLRPTEHGMVEIDYWCDVCAIPMYILKPCECCQGKTRLRERPVEEVFQP